MTDAAVAWVSLVARIREAVAHAEGELGIDVTVSEDIVTLRGVVQSDERRSRIEALSRRVARGLRVRNEITVCPPSAPAAPESLP